MAERLQKILAHAGYGSRRACEDFIYIALYESRNVLSTVEHERGDERQTVRDIVEVPGHLYPVGRLDFESEGLVLMTEEGKLTNRLTHPRSGHTKEYYEKARFGRLWSPV